MKKNNFYQALTMAAALTAAFSLQAAAATGADTSTLSNLSDFFVDPEDIVGSIEDALAMYTNARTLPIFHPVLTSGMPTYMADRIHTKIAEYLAPSNQVLMGRKDIVKRIMRVTELYKKACTNQFIAADVRDALRTLVESEITWYQKPFREALATAGKLAVDLATDVQDAVSIRSRHFFRAKMNGFLNATDDKTVKIAMHLLWWLRYEHSVYDGIFTSDLRLHGIMRRFQKCRPSCATCQRWAIPTSSRPAEIYLNFSDSFTASEQQLLVDLVTTMVDTTETPPTRLVIKCAKTYNPQVISSRLTSLRLCDSPPAQTSIIITPRVFTMLMP
jgi:hypothetical protein